MRPKCYFCDSELDVVLHTFKVSLREEPVCEECYTKTINRKKATEAERRVGGGEEEEEQTGKKK